MSRYYETPDVDPKGRFILRKAHHVFAVIDGRVSNLETGARTRITNIWHFTEA